MKSRIVRGRAYIDELDYVVNNYNPKSLTIVDEFPAPEFIGVYDNDGSPLYRVYEKERIGYVITD